MKYLFLGDTHGDLNFAQNACALAAEHGIRDIIQVGDWGYLWPGSNKVERLAKILSHHGCWMRFIDGNHDEHPRLRSTTEWPDRITYQSRGSAHTDADGCTFLFLGGAPSIDKADRTPGLSWWPEEEITDADYEAASQYDGVDVLVTHDAPGYPPGFAPAGGKVFLKKSADSMSKVRELIERYSPRLHVHGHWHSRYTRGVTTGLGCNSDPLSAAVLTWEAP